MNKDSFDSSPLDDEETVDSLITKIDEAKAEIELTPLRGGIIDETKTHSITFRVNPRDWEEINQVVSANRDNRIHFNRSIALRDALIDWIEKHYRQFGKPGDPTSQHYLAYQAEQTLRSTLKSLGEQYNFIMELKPRLNQYQSDPEATALIKAQAYVVYTTTESEMVRRELKKEIPEIG